VTIHKLVPLLVLALNLLLIGSALAGGRKSHRHYVFACLAGALAIWNLGVFGLRSSGDPATALTWERFVHYGVIPIPVLFYHYVLAFLDRRRDNLLIAGYAICAGFLVVCSSELFMRGVIETRWGYMPLSGPLYLPFFLYFQSYIVLGLIQLLRAYPTLTSSFRRNRTKLVVGGVVVCLTGALVDFVRYILGWDWLYPFGIPSNALFALALGLAIVRYRLLDLGMVAKWAVLYILAACTLGSFLIGAIYGVEWLVAGASFMPDVRYIVAIAVVTTIALPLLRKLEGCLERLMFAREHGVRETLMALSKQMASILDQETLGRSLTDGLVSGVPVMHASLYLGTENGSSLALLAQASSGQTETLPLAEVDDVVAEWLRLAGKPLQADEWAHFDLDAAGGSEMVSRLEVARVALALPLISQRQLAGVLLLGEKVSGGQFHPGEIELLEMLLGQTGIALENARLYSNLRDQMDQLTQTQQQLIQAAKLAAVGKLAAGVAHEINNPLMIMLGNCELALRDGPPDRVAKRLDIIKGEATRAGKITRDLLDFARHREPRQEPVAVGALVARAVELLDAKLHRNRVKVHTALPPDMPSILGDADQLTQVLLNLAGNAVDAMPEGGDLIFEGELRDETDAVVIRIIDTGVGMTPEHVLCIFEPFYTTKPEGQGTGLGMSVSLGIVKSHGGLLHVSSEPGRGTTVTVQLPLKAVLAPAAPELAGQ
jgi:signal transduction histidine kinase